MSLKARLYCWAESMAFAIVHTKTSGLDCRVGYGIWPCMDEWPPDIEDKLMFRAEHPDHR